MGILRFRQELPVTCKQTRNCGFFLPAAQKCLCRAPTLFWCWLLLLLVRRDWRGEHALACGKGNCFTQKLPLLSKSQSAREELGWLAPRQRAPTQEVGCWGLGQQEGQGQECERDERASLPPLFLLAGGPAQQRGKAHKLTCHHIPSSPFFHWFVLLLRATLMRTTPPCSRLLMMMEHDAFSGLHTAIKNEEALLVPMFFGNFSQANILIILW